MSTYINKLWQAITMKHRCRCNHIESQQVTVREGAIVWQGSVELFRLKGHPWAESAYAWGWEGDDGELEYISIPNLAPYDSAAEAVKTMIARGKTPGGQHCATAVKESVA